MGDPFTRWPELANRFGRPLPSLAFRPSTVACQPPHPLSPFFHILAYPFAHIKNSTRLFQAIPNSLHKTPGGVGMSLLTNLEMLFEGHEIPLSALRTGLRDFS